MTSGKKNFYGELRVYLPKMRMTGAVQHEQRLVKLFQLESTCTSSPGGSLEKKQGEEGQQSCFRRILMLDSQKLQTQTPITSQ